MVKYFLLYINDLGSFTILNPMPQIRFSSENLIPQQILTEFKESDHFILVSESRTFVLTFESVNLLEITFNKVFEIEKVTNFNSITIPFKEISDEEYNEILRSLFSTLIQTTSDKQSVIVTTESNIDGYNKIYFGPPGTGKSHAIKEELKKLGVKPENYSRVTFHPDYDYHSFVGGYKPVNEGDVIKYKFVPQVFTDLYLKAWNNQNENYYLVIEEINRGNCAEIFGDIFQLLDRNPEYNIEPSTELREYFEEVNEKRKSAGQDEISLLFDGKLQMPDNLSILASMNTSDQSLYPMDSAFKRRWDWHYVPIDIYCEKSNFVIKIDEKHNYSWLKFLSKVNDKIYKVTKSEDKQIGNWFINASKSDNIISKELFINKVLFYLWNDIFKDEVFHSENIFIEKNSDGSKEDISFNNFHNNVEQDRLLNHLLNDILNVSILPIKEQRNNDYTQESDLTSAAAETNINEEYKENKLESETE